MDTNMYVIVHDPYDKGGIKEGKSFVYKKMDKFKELLEVAKDCSVELIINPHKGYNLNKSVRSYFLDLCLSLENQMELDLIEDLQKSEMYRTMDGANTIIKLIVVHQHWRFGQVKHTSWGISIDDVCEKMIEIVIKSQK